MIDEKRYARIRLLTRGLNQRRKKQAQKIDILCNDLISAHRGFIGKLGLISFTAGFYELILGISDLSTLLCTAGKLIGERIDGINVAFFLRRSNDFELHMFESDHPITLEKKELESCFNPELVSGICAINRICTLEDMFAMGLQGNPAKLNGISAVTIPLGQLGASFGFVLVYRSSERALSGSEIDTIAAVAPGLSRAVAGCRQAMHSLEHHAPGDMR